MKIKNKNNVELNLNNQVRHYLVRSAGLEPARLATHAPQTCLSADSSITALITTLIIPLYRKMSIVQINIITIK